MQFTVILDKRHRMRSMKFEGHGGPFVDCHTKWKISLESGDSFFIVVEDSRDCVLKVERW